MGWIDALPAIGSFLAGPAGGIVGSGVQWLAGKLGASDATVEGIKQTLSGMTPDQIIAIKRLDLDFQKFCLEQDIKLPALQVSVNLEEAKSSSIFVAGWRPFVGWVCGIALAYVAILEPVLRFGAAVWFDYKGSFPVIDTNLTMQVLLGMLGLSGLRSYDKKIGTSK